MKYTLFVLVLMIVSAVSAGQDASSELTINIGGGGGVISNTDHWWESSKGSDINFASPDSDWNYGAAAGVVVTGPGNTVYRASEKQNSSIGSDYDGSNHLEFDGGGVYWNTVAMTDNQPNVPDIICDAAGSFSGDSIAGTNPSYQTVDVQMSGMGNQAVYESDGVISDANLTVDMRAEGQNGFAMFDMDASAYVGFDKNDSDLNFEKHDSAHVMAIGNESTGFYSGISFKWKDHSKPFGLGDEDGQNITINATNNS